MDSEDVEAAKAAQLGEGREAAGTVQKIAEMAEGARVSDESLEWMVRKAVRASGSRADVKTLTAGTVGTRGEAGWSYSAPAKSGSIGQYLAVSDTCQKRKTREATNFQRNFAGILWCSKAIQIRTISL